MKQEFDRRKSASFWQTITIGTALTVISTIVVVSMYAQKLRSDIDFLDKTVVQNKADVQQDINDIKTDTKEIKQMLYKLIETGARRR